jgi:branched-chain amino acid transport system substrate-binding protein
MAFVFDLTTTSLAATSGFIAIMLAVASKIDLSNIIAGLGISFSKVFVIGDWVKIGDIEGQIVEMTPKSTKLKTFNSSIINIPNTTVSSATIENYNRPEGAYRLMIHLETVADYRFEDVERVILDAIYSTEGILKTPKPAVMFHGQGDSSQIYETFFFIDDYSKKALLWQRAWRRIWRHLEMENIILATPQREIFMPKVSEEEITFEYKTIKNSIVFDKLSDAKKLEISNNLESKDYYEGTQIEEDMENNICIVANGAIAMLHKNSDNEIKYFGATEVLNLNDEDKAHRFICKRDSTIFLLNKKYFSLLDTYQSLSSNKVS